MISEWTVTRNESMCVTGGLPARQFVAFDFNFFRRVRQLALTKCVGYKLEGRGVQQC